LIYGIKKINNHLSMEEPMTGYALPSLEMQLNGPPN